jgi:hypothetical protein
MSSILSTTASPTSGDAEVGARVGVGDSVAAMLGVVLSADGSFPPQLIKKLRQRQSKIDKTHFFIYFLLKNKFRNP